MKIRYPMRHRKPVLLETCKHEPSTCEYVTHANIYMPETQTLNPKPVCMCDLNLTVLPRFLCAHACMYVSSYTCLVVESFV